MKMRRGRLIFISSVVGLYGSAGQVNYAASKAGLVGMARSLARELGSRGITANVIAPGFVDSDMTAGLSQDRKAAILAAVPLARFAAAEEVAAAVAFLAGQDAAYITGAVIPVDGGLGMGHSKLICLVRTSHRSERSYGPSFSWRDPGGRVEVCRTHTGVRQ